MLRAALILHAAAALQDGLHEQLHACADLLQSRPSEFCETSEHTCTAAYAPPGRKSCTETCALAGLTCSDAFDDAFDDGRCPPGPELSCDRPLHSRVCRCERHSCDAPTDCASARCVAGH